MIPENIKKEKRRRKTKHTKSYVISVIDAVVWGQSFVSVIQRLFAFSLIYLQLIECLMYGEVTSRNYQAYS